MSSEQGAQKDKAKSNCAAIAICLYGNFHQIWLLQSAATGVEKKMVTGGCLCGAVRFSYDEEIGPAGYCHCADCRRSTGGPYTLSVRLVTSGFEVETASLGEFTKAGESGAAITRHFCVRCGSPVYTSSEHRPEFIHVKAGVLDDPAVVQPVHETWTKSRVVWADIPSEIASYERGRI